MATHVQRTAHADAVRAGAWLGPKNVVMDQRKLDVARRALGVDTKLKQSTRRSTWSRSAKSSREVLRLSVEVAASTTSSSVAGKA